MKLSIGIIIAICLVILGLWAADIASDRGNKVKITEAVSAYSNWECGYSNKSACNVVFDVPAGTAHDVKRIRYGKDFMAIQINQDGLSGWVFSGTGVQTFAKPSS
ncbi:hypothetical protein [Idiomarina sp.]|uniref:hypothetical protein n=1 Tax=Idiomarina sp. TaxID=1874361 RepID=UPI003A8FE5C9